MPSKLTAPSKPTCDGARLPLHLLALACRLVQLLAAHLTAGRAEQQQHMQRSAMLLKGSKGGLPLLFEYMAGRSGKCSSKCTQVTPSASAPMPPGRLQAPHLDCRVHGRHLLDLP